MEYDNTPGGLTLLWTVTPIAPEVVRFPAPSRVTAVSVCAPFGTLVVSHMTEYGAVRSSAPRFAPSSMNWTPTTPTLSDANADTVTREDGDEPCGGVMMETVGEVVSAPLLTATVTPAEVA